MMCSAPLCTHARHMHACMCRYVNGVKPGEYGVPKPFYFPLLPSYWCEGLRYSRVKAVSPDSTRYQPRPFHKSTPTSPGPEGGWIGSVCPPCTHSELCFSPLQPATEGMEQMDSTAHEEEPKDLTVGISIRNLTKIYSQVKQVHLAVMMKLIISLGHGFRVAMDPVAS